MSALFTTAVTVHAVDGRQVTGDFQVFRAESAANAASYARKHHAHIYGHREAITSVRVYNSCATCPKREDGQYTDHCGQECCKFSRYGDCHHATTYSEYAS